MRPGLITPRQQEVLALLVQGKSNREIAEVLGLSEHTVKVHNAAIFRVLGVTSRTEALVAVRAQNHAREPSAPSVGLEPPGERGRQDDEGLSAQGGG
jgi:DNA-binding CsgD family transcriptional regulator